MHAWKTAMGSLTGSRGLLSSLCAWAGAGELLLQLGQRLWMVCVTYARCCLNPSARHCSVRVEGHLHPVYGLELHPVQVIAVSVDVLLVFTILNREAVFLASLWDFQVKFAEVNGHLASFRDSNLPYLILVKGVCIIRSVDVVRGDKIEVHVGNLCDLWWRRPMNDCVSRDFRLNLSCRLWTTKKKSHTGKKKKKKMKCN